MPEINAIKIMPCPITTLKTFSFASNRDVIIIDIANGVMPKLII